MARLKFDLRPIDPYWFRNPQAREDHEAWVREVYARHHPGEDPRPCDCGYYSAADALVTCHGPSRQACHDHLELRLQNHYRDKHLRGLREKRAFPGVPFPKAGRSRCKWCNGEITLGRVSQREWHDGRGDEPDCLYEFKLHTELEAQQGHLLERDGPRCATCATSIARWAKTREADPARWRTWGPRHAARYPPDIWVGPVCPLSWIVSGGEVDHLAALAVVWEAYGDEPDARRRFFGPANLRLLCSACHRTKTREDIALLNRVRGQPDLAYLAIRAMFP